MESRINYNNFLKFILAILFTIIFFSASRLFASKDIYTSKYTSLEDRHCRLLSSSKLEGGSFSRRCPGREGIQIRHEGGDARSWIEIIFPDKTDFSSLDQSHLLPEGFFYVSGKKLEWRYKNKKLIGVIFRMSGGYEGQGEVKLIAVRMNFTIPPDSSLRRACIVGHAKTNKEARILIDSDQACKSF